MASPASRPPAVFVLDVDDTLLDNDALKNDLDIHLRGILGDALTERFWQVYEDVRMAEDTVDYPLTIETFAREVPDAAQIGRVRSLIMNYPFAQRLYPHALATLAHLEKIGLPTIVSDGDAVYQPLKIERSGLAAAVDGRVLVYIHKEEHLDEVMARWPGDVYVMVDDKARILAETKRRYPEQFVTIHVRQGHYGLDPERYAPAPDLVVDSIGDLRAFSLAEVTHHLDH
jgi:FMN phosphatase YigB (HAD superfamily)